MKLLVGPTCCKLDTAVFYIGLGLTAAYLIVGLGSVVWFVLDNSDQATVGVDMSDLYMMRMKTMMGSLALVGTVLVIAFIGLLTCLLLILGIKTEQRLLLLRGSCTMAPSSWDALVEVCTKPCTTLFLLREKIHSLPVLHSSLLLVGYS